MTPEEGRILGRVEGIVELVLTTIKEVKGDVAALNVKVEERFRPLEDFKKQVYWTAGIVAGIVSATTAALAAIF